MDWRKVIRGNLDNWNKKKEPEERCFNDELTKSLPDNEKHKPRMLYCPCPKCRIVKWR